MESLDNFLISATDSDRQIEINESIMNMACDLSMDLTTQLELEIYDPSFLMFKNNYFQIRRPCSYVGYEYEIAAVSIKRDPNQQDSVSVTCRSQVIQKLKREKGQKTWTGISASTFAKQIAEEHGLQYFIQTSNEKTSITRQQSEDVDESTWQVLARLAGDLDYLLFESYGMLFFTSEEFLMERQPGIECDLESKAEDDPWFLHSAAFRASDDARAGVTVSFQVGRTNGQRLRPGFNVSFKNAGIFGEKKYLISSVTWSVGTNQPVAVQARTLAETEDTVADATVGLGVIPWGSRNLSKGMTGTDVKRLQREIGMPDYSRDGVFGTMTEGYVKNWQSVNELGTRTVTSVGDIDPADRHFFGGSTTGEIVTWVGDGIIDQDDWNFLNAAPLTYRDLMPIVDGVPQSVVMLTGGYSSAQNSEGTADFVIDPADRSFIERHNGSIVETSQRVKAKEPTDTFSPEARKHYW
ncbi:MAG: hypothetical protein HOI21_00485 [Bacteroidetes Order II. Incertae sedis bacterium]|jgi:hypothetical protein|nr:hypothetical protein [Bacteroidetes Order II. bacterium]